MKRQIAERSGRDAEARAGLWLRAKGWRILDTRVKTPAGEIDLVAKRGRTVAFVEVKARSTQAEAEQSLDAYRLRRVAAAAEALTPRYAMNGEDVRIDAVFIVAGKLPRHLANIWMG